MVFRTIDVKSLDDTGAGDVANLTESTTTAMQKKNTYTGWDFGDIWTIDEGNDYPRLKWELTEPRPDACSSQATTGAEA